MQKVNLAHELKALDLLKESEATTFAVAQQLNVDAKEAKRVLDHLSRRGLIRQKPSDARRQRKDALVWQCAD